MIGKTFNLKFNFSGSFLNQVLNNKSSIRDYENPLELNWIRIVKLEDEKGGAVSIIDFKSSVVFVLSSFSAHMFAPVSFVEKATGLLINGQ